MAMASQNLNLHKNQMDNSKDHEIDASFHNKSLLPLFRQAY